MSAKTTFAILGVIVTLSIVVAGSLSYPALAAKSNSNSSHGNTKVGDTSPKTSSSDTSSPKTSSSSSSDTSSPKTSSSSSDTSSPKTSSSNAGQTSMGDFLGCLSATDKKGFLKFNAIDCFTTLG
jgi:hypothetical protein